MGCQSNRIIELNKEIYSNPFQNTNNKNEEDLYINFKKICDSVLISKKNIRIINICEHKKLIKFRKGFVDYLKKNFSFLSLTSPNHLGLMTGYYEPEIRAYKAYEEGRYPIYKNPAKYNYQHLIKHSRKKINSGILKNKNLEIAWAENEIEAFFLQVQGSGRLKFKNGDIKRVRYAGSNEKKYTSIGRLLLREEILKESDVSMYSIKKWLYNNPNKARDIMEQNERFIYFEEYEGNIKGSANTELIPLISIAVDPRYHNEDSIFLIRDIKDSNSLFFAIAHDKGIAIKGLSRIDLFTGFGNEAEKKAASLNSSIIIWKLQPNL